MPEIQHLDKAPITEALVDIRVPTQSEFDVSKLEAVHKDVANSYPVKEERLQQEIVFELSESAFKQKSKKHKAGYFFKTQANNRVAQFRVDGFTYSWLKPYESWEALRDEAKRLWNIYSGVRQPSAINRIAVRYINRIEIPLPVQDFRDYLSAAPEVPSRLPQGVSSFLLRVVVPDPKTGAIAIITQALEALVDPAIAPIILDIDVFNEKAFEPDGAEVWEAIESLRNFKNQIFFESVTDKALEMFK